jgi:6-phosphogluconolactonase/glucosamine-6-phosphate isomerase/deaminase
VNGELVVVDDVAGEFAERVIECYHARPADGFSIALSGGDTARRCYERLADDAGTQIDWWKVDVYWGDERCVPLDHPDSNYRLAREALLDRVGAANATYPMRCEEGPDSYQLRIGDLGKFDLIHLGLGADGHTASLFPGSPALEADPGRLVVFNEDPLGRGWWSSPWPVRRSAKRSPASWPMTRRCRRHTSGATASCGWLTRRQQAISHSRVPAGAGG